ncbi:MAG TPA: hypothetical protein VHC18_28680 [Amycolatopsis sp.]|nr:hypothetical protein [Amycolatopsis sp.]
MKTSEMSGEMSDSDQHNVRMGQRASTLCDRLDDVISALMVADRAASEVARSDLDVAGEMGSTDHSDLVRCLEDAEFQARTAERIAHEHLDHVRRAAAGKIRKP